MEVQDKIFVSQVAKGCDISPRTPVVSQLSLELLKLKAGLTALETKVEAGQNVILFSVALSTNPC